MVQILTLTSKTPRGGCRNPVKMSGRRIGKTTASIIVFLAYSNPAILLHSEKYEHLLEKTIIIDKLMQRFN